MKSDLNRENLKICVVIFVYNRTRFIKDALESILAQTFEKRNTEIILITNCELLLLDNYIRNYNIKLIRSQGTLGDYLYLALTQTSADIISFLDDDDLFFHNKLEYLNREFMNDPKLVFLHNNYTIYRQGNLEIPRSKMTSRIKVELDGPISLRIFKKLVYNRIDFNMSCITIRRSAAIWALDAIRKIKAWPDTVLFLVSLNYRGNLILDNLILTAYRVHSDNISSLISSKNPGTFISKIKKNYELRVETCNLIMGCFNDKIITNFLTERMAVWNSTLFIIDQKKGLREVLYKTKQLFLGSIRIKSSSIVIIFLLLIYILRPSFSKLIYYKLMFNQIKKNRIS
jgi:glycosyltransferase involved in cell wall biosynthesis